VDDVFSLGQANGQPDPSPILFPDVRFAFTPHTDPTTGEKVGFFLTLWLTSLPIVRCAIPFDRLSFAQFVKEANQMLSGVEEG